MEKSQSSDLEWRDGRVPVSRRFEDPYFSIEDGLAETRHVFLQGNDLPDRLGPGFAVAELGVGTGLNLMALWKLAQEAGQPVQYTGFEAYPMAKDDLARALAAFPGMDSLSTQFIDAWATQSFRFETPEITAQIIIGDARTGLPGWQGQANAWFLDGFAPARNPELWEPELMVQVAAHTAPKGTFATYTAAGAVRRALTNAGFDVERVPGYGRKRHMTRGVLRGG